MKFFFYSNLSLSHIQPACAPCSGGTRVALVGDGFITSTSIRVKFYGAYVGVRVKLGRGVVVLDGGWCWVVMVMVVVVLGMG